MDEMIFKTALSAVSSGEYGEADLLATFRKFGYDE